MEHSLGCDRTKLQELKVYFIPDILNKMHERQALVDFSKAHIKRFSNVCIVLNLEPIWGLPRVECKVYEFEPLTRDLLFQYQYVKNQTTGKWDLRKQPCPPIAMIEVENMDRQIYDQYLTDVADNYLGEFAGRFYKSEQDDFCARLLHLMVQYHRASGPNDEEKSLLHEIFRLLVATYIMGRSITIPRSQWPRLTKLKSHAHSSPSWATHISPRMTNKQLKYLWSSLFNSAMDSVLKRLQQSLRSSNGDKKWTSAFCAFLGLAMCFEDVQRTVHVFCESDAKDGLCAQDVADRRAEDTCRATDEKFRFMAALFRAKHSRFNPFRPGPAREKIGPAARGLVEGVEELVREKSEFLQERQHQEILAANQGRYTARLLARFLLPFWGPSREV
ncbi:hypothetical protein EJ06DRAFT_526134 [Trichodelitschia bisporula]|uniref:Uncharacterized protein n=1 Tax=Trichodelitschia bisporula TaxID=703511 RepID=A0A6G1IBQ1_9PEZI|nr:hypothetical protein EJ06DRAFT_526134 [Trichodelitschia bisporula]